MATRDDIEARVEEANRLLQMIQPGDTVVVGCSGGADSMCLLHLLATGALGFSVTCHAVYVDHGLREETHAEQALVQEAAQRIGASFRSICVDVPKARATSGGSIQDVARTLRYEALRTEANRIGAASVAVGHTLSDQAETLLLHLIRGTGTAGLAGMLPKRDGIVRPLLVLTRDETEQYCRLKRITFFDDPTNFQDTYVRNRIRRHLIPHLREFNPRIEETLARTAEILRAEDEYLEQEARAAYEALIEPSAREGERLILDASRLHQLPRALARRVIRLTATAVQGRPTELSFAQIEAILDMAASTEGSAELHASRGLVVRREYTTLRFQYIDWSRLPAASASPGKDHPVALALPGRTKLPWANTDLVASVHSATEATAQDGGPMSVTLDFDRVVPPLWARPRRAGDRMSPVGLGGTKKVKDILIDAKVPRSIRDEVVVVLDQKGIVWLVGHAVDDRVKVTPASARLLSLHVQGKPHRSG